MLSIVTCPDVLILTSSFSLVIWLKLFQIYLGFWRIAFGFSDFFFIGLFCFSASLGNCADLKFFLHLEVGPSHCKLPSEKLWLCHSFGDVFLSIGLKVSFDGILDFFHDTLVVATCCWTSTCVISSVFLVTDSWFHSLGLETVLEGICLKPSETCCVAPRGSGLHSVLRASVVHGWRVPHLFHAQLRTLTAPVSLLRVCLDDWWQGLGERVEVPCCCHRFLLYLGAPKGGKTVLAPCETDAFVIM